MCIPCVMCGACMDLDESADLEPETTCPECGLPVSPSDISCPNCFTILTTNVFLKRQDFQEQHEVMAS